MKKLLFVLAILLAAAPAFAQHGVALQIGSWGPGDAIQQFIFLRSATSGGPYTAVCGGNGQPACPAFTGTQCATAPVCPSFMDANVKAGDTWYYVAEASGLGGVSGPSNEVKAQIPFLPPPAPSGLQQTSH